MVKKCLKNTVVVLYAAVLVFVIIKGPLKKDYSDMGIMIYLMMTAAFFGLMYVAKKVFDENEDKLDKYFKVVLGAYLAVMFIVQIIPAKALRFVPAWDLDAVFGGAVSWLNNGDLHEYTDYFLWFKNNFGLLTINKCVFSVVHIIFGEHTDYYMTAVVMGSISLTVTRFSIAMICKKLLGTSASYFGMLVMMTCPVMYFMSEAFYTDVLSLWAAPLAVLLFICAKQSADMQKKAGFYIGSAVAAAFGAQIKFTVLIIVIALAISLLIRFELKDLGIFAASQLVIFGIVFGSMNAIYNENFDAEAAALRNTPLTHWIMMGAKGNGSYNGADYDFTRSFEDISERDREIKKEIARRYKERGLSGTLELWTQKTGIDFGDGTLGISDFLDDNVVNKSGIHELILYNGKHYSLWQTICNSHYLAVLIFMLFAAVPILRSKKQDGVTEIVVPALFMSFIGLWLFLMMWEASARYFSNFYGIMILTAVFGAQADNRSLAEAEQTDPQKPSDTGSSKDEEASNKSENEEPANAEKDSETASSEPENAKTSNAEETPPKTPSDTAKNEKKGNKK